MSNIFTDMVWSLSPKKVYGLIGPAGSGKSFRAFLVADKFNIEYIIDDGLLIKDQKILCGKSAKRETLKVTAIKRAIFYETKHAREVRKRLYNERFKSILILGTSESMVYKIAKRLHIPKPSKYIRIEDIATREEIIRAQKSRLQHGKHVMPIPLVEVKKKYPNIVLHAIHFFIDEPQGFFFFKKNKKKLVEKTIVKPEFGNSGSISISETALVQMVTHCIKEYSNNIRLLKVLVREHDYGLSLELEVAVNYKFNNTKVIKDIQKIIKVKIEEFTKISIDRVDIDIVKVIYDS